MSPRYLDNEQCIDKEHFSIEFYSIVLLLLPWLNTSHIIIDIHINSDPLTGSLSFDTIILLSCWNRSQASNDERRYHWIWKLTQSFYSQIWFAWMRNEYWLWYWRLPKKGSFRIRFPFNTSFSLPYISTVIMKNKSLWSTNGSNQCNYFRYVDHPCTRECICTEYKWYQSWMVQVKKVFRYSNNIGKRVGYSHIREV